MKKSRVIYGAAFCVLLLTEVFIGLFVNDSFVRPYIGDLLVTVLICCLLRTVIPQGVNALPLFVFVFAALTEVAQYFDIVKLLGLEGNRLLCVIIGRTFSVADLICYGVGCAAFVLTEAAIKVCISGRRRSAD